MNINSSHIPQSVIALAAEVKEQGGIAFLVGGSVIDLLKGRVPKDFDIEIHRIEPERIPALGVSGVSISQDPKGASFGVFIAKDGVGTDIDISLPRTENKVGKGHTAFSVSCDPFMGTEKAARRRDLTINSLMLDLSTFEIVDHFGGLKDLETGLIRHVDDSSFVEDPLRVLRIMQIVARKGKEVDPFTTHLAFKMVNEFDTLSKERFEQEFLKLLMKAEKPSVGLQFLVDCGWIVHFPELNALRFTPQNIAHHPEGNVWNHTLMVVDAAAKIRDTLPTEWQIPFMFGMLLHDVGKAVTTDSQLRAHGHAEAGVDIAMSFMRRISTNKGWNAKIKAIVKEHMNPASMHKNKAGLKAWRKLHIRIALPILQKVVQADCEGIEGLSADKVAVIPHMTKVIAEIQKLGELEEFIPLVTGHDLIALGVEAGPELGRLKREAKELQLGGLNSKDEIIQKLGL